MAFFAIKISIYIVWGWQNRIWYYNFALLFCHAATLLLWRKKGRQSRWVQQVQRTLFCHPTLIWGIFARIAKKMADSSQLIHSLILHKGHHTWNLHIRDVQRTDAGAYMCQINTAKAKTRMGHLTVVGKWFWFLNLKV